MEGGEGGPRESCPAAIGGGETLTLEGSLLSMKSARYALFRWTSRVRGVTGEAGDGDGDGDGEGLSGEGVRFSLAWAGLGGMMGGGGDGELASGTMGGMDSWRTGYVLDILWALRTRLALTASVPVLESVKVD